MKVRVKRGPNNDHDLMRTVNIGLIHRAVKPLFPLLVLGAITTSCGRTQGEKSKASPSLDSGDGSTPAESSPVEQKTPEPKKPESGSSPAGGVSPGTQPPSNSTSNPPVDTSAPEVSSSEADKKKEKPTETARTDLKEDSAAKKEETTPAVSIPDDKKTPELKKPESGSTASTDVSSTIQPNSTPPIVTPSLATRSAESDKKEEKVSEYGNNELTETSTAGTIAEDKKEEDKKEEEKKEEDDSEAKEDDTDAEGSDTETPAPAPKPPLTLTSVTLSTNVPALPTVLSPMEATFCQGLKKGECLSLVFLVPGPKMVKDLGLSILSMAGSIPDLKYFRDDSCVKGVSDFIQENRGFHFIQRPLRQKVARKIKRARCVFVPLNSFRDEEFSWRLHENETAIMVRMTRYEIESHQSDTTLNFLEFRKKQTQTHFGFRDVRVAYGIGNGRYKPEENKLYPDTVYWYYLNKMGFESNISVGAFDQSFRTTINMDTLKYTLGKVISNGAGGPGQAIGEFLTLAQSIVTGDPSSGSLAIMSMGLKSIGSVCGIGGSDPKDAALCNYVHQTGFRTSELESIFGTGTSQTEELNRVGIIKGVKALLNDIFVKGDAYSLKHVFGI